MIDLRLSEISLKSSIKIAAAASYPANICPYMKRFIPCGLKSASNSSTQINWQSMEFCSNL